MANAIGVVFEFGSFRLDAAKRLLTRGGAHLTLPPKTFDLLLLLVESRGRVFAKKELMAALWPDTFVEDASLTFQVSALRKALGGEGIEWIETLPRYGYRFAGEVLEVETSPPPESAVWAPPEAVVAPPPPPPAGAIGRARNQYYSWSLTVIMTIIACYLAVTHLREPEERAVSFLITLPDLVTTPDVGSIAMSPNGDRVLFIGVRPDGRKQLWVRALDSPTADVIAGTDLVDGAFWSPDGRSVAFFAAGKLKTIDLQGGSQQIIGDTPVGRSSGTWSRDGVILFETTAHPEVYSVAARGGKPTPVTRLNTSDHEIRHSAPQFLPDGHHFIYYVQSERPENSGIYIGSLDSKGTRRLTNANANGVYTKAKGAYYLLYTRDTNLMGQDFDVTRRELAGTPFVVVPRLLIGFGGGHPRAEIGRAHV